ncbi:MAG: hypothetical protein ABI082_12525 [Dokdonella sp.]
MEFHIEMAQPSAALGTIEKALFDVDPMSVVDIESTGKILRVSTAMTAAQLLELLRQSGLVLAPKQVVQLPSICCGGCSG